MFQQEQHILENARIAREHLVKNGQTIPEWLRQIEPTIYKQMSIVERPRGIKSLLRSILCL